jgi:predicted aldo/keto reductase-like oxidoreductase
MIYRPYGKTGKKVSLLGFGGMRFGAIDDRDACVRMMVRAAKAGVTYFDTAPDYFGVKSEAVFGHGFRELSRQGLPFFCATKTFQSTEKGIRREVEAQLKRLGRDAIDFYHVWCITSLEEWRNRKKDGVTAAFRRLKEEGLVRHICVSSHLIGEKIRELLMEGVFEGVLFGYSAYNFHVREKAFEAIAAHNLGCVVMNPLGGGIIPQNQSLFGFLRARQNETVIQAALRFLFSHTHISVVLVGFSRAEEIDEAVAAMEGFTPVSPAEIARIKARLGDSFTDLCTGCQYCDSCPEAIPIPKLMEAWNHGKLYGKSTAITDRLSWHWSIAPSEAGRCTECGQCEKLCTQHLPIISRMAEIAGLGSGKK